MWLELFQEAERCGYGLMFNEHHQTAISLNPTSPLMAAAVARLTTTAPLLILGNPIANRPDPVRVAEEMAVLDLLSHGRLHCGFVRGVPFELSATNATPLRSTERFWEAHDLIVKAWTSHDGPFSWTGEFFEHRQVNVWPRPYQQPHPPVWITTLNPASTPPIADHGYTVATFLVGFDGARDIFQAYRARRRDQALEERDDHFAYAAVLAVGATEEEGRRRAEELMWFMQADKVAAPFILPPGYVPPRARLDALAGIDTFHLRERSLDDLIETGMAFAGSPQTVFAQIKRFHDHVGGFGHLLAIQHSGHLKQGEVVDSMRLFAAEVMPRLGELSTPPVERDAGASLP
jgi:alkanesulfonate monooxygenase SsuD/methylene tetrahydromethanopterin reductase-like flavin-dependent oxidoreductase (luciferase family)